MGKGFPMADVLLGFAFGLWLWGSLWFAVLFVSLGIPVKGAELASLAALVALWPLLFGYITVCSTLKALLGERRWRQLWRWMTR